MHFFSLEDCQKLIVRRRTSCRKAIQTINDGALQIALVVDPDGLLRGILTDNDLRRKALDGINLKASVTNIYNAHPHTVKPKTSRNRILEKFDKFGIYHLPVIDDDGNLLGLYHAKSHDKDRYAKTPIVIMAGGEGKRLRPLTEKCPKPMLKILGRPMLEHIIEHLKSQGFSSFYISVNYLGHVIEDYFGSGQKHGVNIKYLYEKKKLGTGGALSLLPDDLIGPVLVTNGDVITEFDFRGFLDDHLNSNNAATMGIRKMLTEIPFGVVNFDEKRFKGMTEKPTLTHFINSGIYAVSEEAIKQVPADQFFDMPTLFDVLTAGHEKCGVHFIQEASWIDVGNPTQLELANEQLKKR